MNQTPLSKVVETFKLQCFQGAENIPQVNIFVPDVIRPGLQLAGNYMHFGPDRIQVLGNMEIAYLERLQPSQRQARLNTLFATGIPCLILARGYKPMKEMEVAARNFGVAILGTDEATGSFSSSLIKYLNVELADRLSMHGVLVEVYGEGVLLLGESGVGKSETALEIIKRGHRLIADDLVEIRRVSDTTLLGRAPDIIRYLIEIRGVGILDIKELYGVSSVKYQDNIDFILKLEYWDESKNYERFGLQDEYTEILGIQVPSITIPVRPGRNLAVIVEAAAINFRQKTMGYDAAKALAERVFGQSNVMKEGDSLA